MEIGTQKSWWYSTDWDVRRRASQNNWHGKMADLDSLEAHIDSSATQLMLDTIANLSTNDTVLKNVLLNHSPLSDAVLSAYLDRDTIKTEPNFRAVWLKNLPSSAAVWPTLQVELAKLKDPAVRDTLKGAQISNPNATTATSLNREIRYHGGLTNSYADEVVGYYVDNDAIDSAKAYMDTVNLYPLRIALLGTELGEGNWDEADSSLVKLPLKNKNDSAVYDLFDMLIDLGRNDLTMKAISGVDSTRVQQIAADTTLDSAVMAKGILSVLLDTLYFELPEQIPSAPSEKRGEEEPQEESIESPTEATFFKVYPNPFGSSTTIEYDLGNACEHGCKLRLYDVQGRIIIQEIMTAERETGNMVIDMGRYGNGIYYCTLYGEGRMLQTEKLILLK